MNDKKIFTTFQKFDLNIETIFKKINLVIQEIDDAIITTIIKKKCVNILLTEIVYVFTNTCNFFFLSMLIEKTNFHEIWNDRDITIFTKKDNLVEKIKFSNELYQLRFVQDNISFSNSLVATITNFDDIVWLWHRRLNHMSWKNMKKLFKQSIDMNFIDKQIRVKLKIICFICVTTKALNKISRNFARRRYKNIDDFVVFDIWKRYFIVEINEIQHVIFDTNDACRRTWIKFYFDKKVISNLLKIICKNIKITYDTRVKRIRIDNEFLTNKIKFWTQKNDIELEFSAFYAHNQVDTIERINKTMRKKASAMIQNLNMFDRIINIITTRATEMLRFTTISEFLWSETIKHAV